MNAKPQHTIIRRKEVEARTGLARATIYALARSGRFPAPIPLAGRAVGWLQSDVDTWIAERVAAAMAPRTAGRGE